MNIAAERERVRKEREHAPTTTLCACGCGATTMRGRGVEANRYIRGHATRGQRFADRHDRPHGLFKGGRNVKQSGYIVRFLPDHPRASYGYVAEHILIAEAALGRPLSVAHPVHHVDHDRSNNANTNLVICQDVAYHALLHRRERAFDACGDANARPCGFCYKHDSVANMAPWGTTGGYAHASCAREYRRQWDAKRRAS